MSLHNEFKLEDPVEVIEGKFAGTSGVISEITEHGFGRIYFEVGVPLDPKNPSKGYKESVLVRASDVRRS